MLSDLSLSIFYSIFNVYKSFLKNKWSIESSNSNLLIQITGKINYLFYVNYDPYEDEKINGNEKAEIIKYSRKNLYSKNIRAVQRRGFLLQHDIYQLLNFSFRFAFSTSSSMCCVKPLVARLSQRYCNKALNSGSSSLL